MEIGRGYIQSYLVNIRRFIVTFNRFTRYNCFGYSVILPLLGAATVSVHVTSYKILTLLCVALVYHNFTYVLNDIFDLPIDKNTPSKANSPLVRGQISLKQALFFVLIQIPLIFALTIWQGGGLG